MDPPTRRVRIVVRIGKALDVFDRMVNPVMEGAGMGFMVGLGNTALRKREGRRNGNKKTCDLRHAPYFDG